MLLEKPRIPVRSILLHGLWPSFIKIPLYRLMGYQIGKGVSIGFGSVICGERVEVGDHTSIGFLTIIRGKEIRLGPYVQIGSTTFLDTPHIDIGEGTKINEQVFVGGLQFPDSRFSVGRNCQIMQMSFINPARSIVIGDDSGIGGHCLIFGHSSFQNYFEGYAVDFAPIEIGSGVGLAWRVFVLPGTKIGNGTMVGAGSVVSGTLPPCSMAVGFPAKIVGKAPVFPKSISDEEKVEMFRRIVAEMIQFFMGSGLECEQDGTRYEVRRPTRRWRRRRSWQMQVTDGPVREAVKNLGPARLDVFLSLEEIPGDVREFLRSREIMWIDITKKEQSRTSNDLGEEVLSFLKRYGVRTLRYPPVSACAQTSQVDSNLGKDVSYDSCYPRTSENR
jgi:acetyltransferase-like isoleucine patch superfamily enzyme